MASKYELAKLRMYKYAHVHICLGNTSNMNRVLFVLSQGLHGYFYIQLMTLSRFRDLTKQPLFSRSDHIGGNHSSSHL